MKKILMLLLLLISGCQSQTITNDYQKIYNNSEHIITKIESKEENIPQKEKNNYVSYNGFLNIKNNTLVNEQGEKIMLRGISSHGIQWFSEFINDKNIKTIKKWGANVFRLAMYTDEGGYLSNNDIKNKLYEMVDIVIQNDMYVIIDWHILRDNNPLYNLESAKEFFDEVSKKYNNTPNVIFEICNEPNNGTTWDDIYKYATEIIETIRKNNQKAIIIVGTPTWSQDIDKASEKPLNDNLTMYALHFYSGTHKEDLRNKLKNTINRIPIIVSEFGVTDASGYSNIDLNEAKTWINLLEENNISWINWSLTNKDEGASLLTPNSSIYINDENLSISGKFIKEMLQNML